MSTFYRGQDAFCIYRAGAGAGNKPAFIFHVGDALKFTSGAGGDFVF